MKKENQSIVEAKRDAARKMAEDQHKADFAHHTKRIEWLKQENPVWACGTPLGKWERFHLLEASERYMDEQKKNGGRYGYGYRSCNCEPRCA